MNIFWPSVVKVMRIETQNKVERQKRQKRRAKSVGQFLNLSGFNLQINISTRFKHYCQGFKYPFRKSNIGNVLLKKAITLANYGSSGAPACLNSLLIWLSNPSNYSHFGLF